MVLTYLHLLDPESFPLILDMPTDICENCPPIWLWKKSHEIVMKLDSTYHVTHHETGGSSSNLSMEVN